MAKELIFQDNDLQEMTDEIVDDSLVTEENETEDLFFN